MDADAGDKIKEIHDDRKKINAERIGMEQKGSKNASVYQKQEFSDYDVKLACVKVAMISYIVYADKAVSVNEQCYLDSIWTSTKNKFGYEVYRKIKQAYDSCTCSFMNVQDYLREIKLKDLEDYVRTLDEVSDLDGCVEAEEKAIQRIKDYVDQLEAIKSGGAAICSGCGGRLRLDDYGYKATCESCGTEVIINSDNAPKSSTVEEDNTQANNAGIQVAPADNKKKKGRLAAKIALGVMTGGVSLIPDAVGAAKKKGKG